MDPRKVDKLSLKPFNLQISPCDAKEIPDAIWLEVMLLATPLELLNFQILSKRFHRILSLNPRCWAQARGNMDPCVPPPPKVEAAGVWTESAYAQLIFGGGNCIVKPCKRWTTEFPLSFALRIRVCSKHCKNVIQRGYDKTEKKIHNGYLTSCSIPGKRGLRAIGQAQRLHFRDWLVYDEREMTKYPMYRLLTLVEADTEWYSARAVTETRKVRPPVKVIRSVSQLKAYKLRAEALPRIIENAKALQKWSQEYAQARKSAELMNVTFIREVISPREQIPYRKLLSTPTGRKLINDFSQSLSKIDLRSWCTRRSAIVREYREFIRNKDRKK